MKVILLKDVKGLGNEGDLVDSKTGYARNYLFPKKLAVEATSANMKKWEADNKLKEERKEEDMAEAKDLKEKLENIQLVIKAKGGKEGKLFGSITSQDISNALEKQHKIKIDKRKIDLKENIKNPGLIKLDVRVYPEINAGLSVNVVTE